MQLTQAMMGTTQLRVVAYETLCPVTPKRAGKSGAKWCFNAAVIKFVAGDTLGC